MASADFLTFVVTMFRFEYVYSFSPTRPPRVSVTTFASYICCIYTLKFGQYWTSFCYGNSSVSSMPYMQFLFVRPRLCLRLPSDSTSRWTPLPLANSSYCQVCSGLSPPSDSACRAHIYNACSNEPQAFLHIVFSFSYYISSTALHPIVSAFFRFRRSSICLSNLPSRSIRRKRSTEAR